MHFPCQASPVARFPDGSCVSISPVVVKRSLMSDAVPTGESGQLRGWSRLCPPDRPDLLQPLCLACVGPPAAFTPRQFSRVSRSLELALFHQVSPDMSSPLWASLPLCFQPWNPTVEGQPLQVFSLCESFLQLVHLRGACWGHSHPHGFPPGCFPQCLAP